MKYGAAVAVFIILGFTSCEGSQVVQDDKQNIATNQSEPTPSETVNTIPSPGLLTDWWTKDDLEGRGKKYKKHLLHLLAVSFLIKGAILPIKIAFLKLLTGKALLITVMALMLISIVSLKKISSGGHSHGPQVINLVPQHHGVYGRDLGSQDLAYRHWTEKDALLR